MREIIIASTNQALFYLWVFIVIGIVHLLFIKRHIITEFINSKETRSVKMFAPIFYRLIYPILGVALVYFSYAIISTVISIFSPAQPVPIDYSALTVTGFTSFIKYYSQYAGLFSVTGLICTGLVLILSAGRKFMLIIAGVLAVLTFAYLIATVTLTY